MAHNPKLGIWHTTTLQSARENHQTYNTASVAGQKRTYDSLHSASSGQNPDGTATPAAPPPAFKRPSLRPGPPRLTASPIDHACPPTNKDVLPSEYSQRQAISATPSSTIDPLLSLWHPTYGLPRNLVANLAALGIRSIYPWQKQCLLGPGLLQGEKNLVYSAPTGGGKSLVADVLMLKRVLADREAKAILVLPYVALVQEKVRWLRNVVNGISRKELGQTDGEDGGRRGGKFWVNRADRDTIRVVGFFGGSKVRATWADFDVAVCTIEKVSGGLREGIWGEEAD